MAESLFKVGTKVALIRNGYVSRSVQPRVVSKVRKDGKFFISRLTKGPGEAEPFQFSEMWTPSKFNSSMANKTGRSYSREHLAIWTDEHDAEASAINARNLGEASKAKLLASVQALDMDSPLHRAHVESLLAKFNPEDLKDK